MDAEAQGLAVEALTYAWREHCGVAGEDTGSAWPQDEATARSLSACLERLGYTIVPTAEYEQFRARPQMRLVQERPPLTLDLGDDGEATDA